MEANGTAQLEMLLDAAEWIVRCPKIPGPHGVTHILLAERQMDLLKLAVACYRPVPMTLNGGQWAR